VVHGHGLHPGAWHGLAEPGRLHLRRRLVVPHHGDAGGGVYVRGLGLYRGDGGRSERRPHDGSVCPRFGPVAGAKATKSPCTVSILDPRGGTVSPPPGQYTYDSGETVPISATPDAEHVFFRWDGNYVWVHDATAPSTTMTVQAQGNLEPIFGHRITVCSPTNGELLSPDPGDIICGHWRDSSNAGDWFSAMPVAGYRFLRWDCSGVTMEYPTACATRGTATANGSVCPVFERGDCTVTVCAPTGGTVSPLPGTYTYSGGHSTVIEATPALGYRFGYWESGGVTLGDEWAGTTVMTVWANGSVCPVFDEVPSPWYTVTVCTPTNGSVGPLPGIYAWEVGGYFRAYALPAEGYRFVRWDYSGMTREDVPFDDDRRGEWYGNVNADGSICPVFEKGVRYTVEIHTPTNGSVSPSPGIYIFDAGSTIPITATPAVGYVFGGWRWWGGAVADPTAASTTMTVHYDGTVDAAFVDPFQSYTVDVQNPRGGAPSPQVSAPILTRPARWFRSQRCRAAVTPASTGTDTVMWQ
jgi:hypothetical protein